MSSCHLSLPADDEEPPLCSDFGFLTLAAPRNMAIPANADPDYNDLGLCSPQRTDLANHSEYCGLFRTPTLRNVALKKSFLHNGYFHTLRDVVAFYATRDSDSGCCIRKTRDGTIRL
ncbi:cytochrome-c domain-containing protein [Rhizobium sp. TAL182]|nr:cytochrome-c domain-containing protein [Rhizobium sp. TAL182]